MNTYKFELGEKVRLALSSEHGVVIGRAEYEHMPPNYWVRYLAGDGCQREGWFEAAALQ
ncbi:hypothetical protein [Bordetella avium]|uniref:hypothetical protein n=1 Tax=Bordetella avium TaxID=521 RepID=UPI0016023685|nr:hypothetical protein [Bordetella avium]